MLTVSEYQNRLALLNKEICYHLKRDIPAERKLKNVARCVELMDYYQKQVVGTDVLLAIHTGISLIMIRLIEECPDILTAGSVGLAEDLLTVERALASG